MICGIKMTFERNAGHLALHTAVAGSRLNKLDTGKDSLEASNASMA
jgi:hypothetical protein